MTYDREPVTCLWCGYLMYDETTDFAPYCSRVCMTEAEQDEPPRPSSRLTRHEQLEGLADRGIDTWEDYRGEK